MKETRIGINMRIGIEMDVTVVTIQMVLNMNPKAHVNDAVIQNMIGDVMMKNIDEQKKNEHVTNVIKNAMDENEVIFQHQ